MIRYISLLNFKEGTPDEDVEAFEAAFMALDIDGMVSRSAARGLPERERDADFIITADFEDEAAFGRYDTDPDHEALRAGLASRILAGGTTARYTVESARRRGSPGRF